MNNKKYFFALSQFSHDLTGDFVCASCLTIRHLSPSENKMSNARQMTGLGMGGIGIDRAIRLCKIVFDGHLPVFTRLRVVGLCS